MKKRLHFFIAGGLLIIGIILGSIFDLRINEALFDRYNGFGLAVSSFGMLPGYGCLAFFGGALTAIVARDKNMKTWLKVILYIFSVAAYGIGTYFLGKDVFSINGFYHPELHPWLGCIIMGVILAPVFVWGYMMGRKNENPKMWIIILVLSAAIFIALVPGVTLLKSIMHRPRYRIVVLNGYESFHDWWKPCSNYKEIITNINDHFGSTVLTSEEFKSFPSGHSSAVMVGTILLSTLPLFDKRLLKWQPLLFWGAFAWGLVVMFSRMLVGAHYLTDTCMGALLTILFYYIANEIVIHKLLPQEEVKEEEPVPQE